MKLDFRFSVDTRDDVDRMLIRGIAERLEVLLHEQGYVPPVGEPFEEEDEDAREEKIQNGHDALSSLVGAWREAVVVDYVTAVIAESGRDIATYVEACGSFTAAVISVWVPGEEVGGNSPAEVAANMMAVLSGMGYPVPEGWL